MNKSEESNDTYPTQLERYKKLADNLLSETAKKDERIFMHAVMNITCDTLTPEETVMHSYLFDIALQAKAAEDNALDMGLLYISIEPAFKLFIVWTQAGLINEKLWQNDMRALIRVATLDTIQFEWLDVVLEDMNQYRINKL